jgi:hypothetical protein
MWDQVSHPNGKQHAKWQDFYIFPFSTATKETFSRGKVTRTWSSIYCQGEQGVELTFTLPYAFIVHTKDLFSFYHYHFQMRDQMTTHAKSLVQSSRWIESILNFFMYVTLMCWASFPYIQNFLHFQRM